MLAILTSHPIQYQVPIWRALAMSGNLPFEVWYLTDHGVNPSRDEEFGKSFAWDLDMCDGYPHRFMEIEPGATLKHFRGVKLREKLANEFAQRNVTALWVEGWRLEPFWTAVETAHRMRIPVWLRGESNDLKRDPWLKSVLKRIILGAHFRRVDQFLCIGSANLRLYQSYGIDSSKLNSAPYCVDNERFQEVAERLRPRKSQIRKQWNISENAFCILFCGKFISKKRPLDCIDAVTQLLIAKNETKFPHLLFVGSGQLGGEMRKRCQVIFDAEAACNAVGFSPTASDDAPRASFTGFINQTKIAEAYLAADVLVLPSDFGETWGLVVNEAMACGIPTVVSDQCGSAEDLSAKLSPELVFRCGDTDDLARAIAFAMENPFSVERVQEIAYTHHLKHTIETVLELYSNPEKSSCS